MKHFLVIISGLLWLSGCASQLMQGYVGKDVTEVVLDYGPPMNALDLPDGRRAFQWSQDSSYVTPVTTNVSGYGNYATATTTGGQVIDSECVYTLFGRPNAQKSYTITGFRKPTFMCE